MIIIQYNKNMIGVEKDDHFNNFIKIQEYFELICKSLLRTDIRNVGK